MGNLFQSFFLGIGGFTRWLFFKIMNLFFEKNYPNELEYYMEVENIEKDKNGMTNFQKNFIVGILALIVILLIIEKIES